MKRFLAITTVTLAGLLTACSTADNQPPTIDSLETIAIEEVETEAPSRPFPADSFYSLLVAEFAVRRNRFDIALGNYLQQAHETGDKGVTQRATRLAQFLRADKATLDASQLWIELEPENLEAQYTNATMLAKNQRPLEALKRMVVVLENNGNTNFPAIAASSLPLPLITRNLVEDEIDRLITQYPKNVQLLTSKTLLLQQRNENESALATIQQAILLDETNSQAYIVEARLLQKLKRFDEAYNRLKMSVEQFPNNHRLRLQYARLLMTRDISEAQNQFEWLLSKTPQDPALLLSLALVSKETDQIDLANDYLQRLLTTGQRNNDAYFYLGQLAELTGELQLAIDYYKNIQISNHFINATNRMISLYLQQGRETTAKEYLVGLRQQHPQYSIRLYLLESELLMRNQRYEEGHQLLSEALLISPNQAGLLYARSMFSEKLNDFEALKLDLQTIIDQDPDNVIALNALGYVLANRGESLDDAYEMINKAVLSNPENPAFLDSLGWVEYRRGNIIKAEELLRKAYEAYPDHEVAAHLGEVLWIQNKNEEAIKIWQEALKQKPDSRIILETIERLGGEITLNN